MKILIVNFRQNVFYCLISLLFVSIAMAEPATEKPLFSATGVETLAQMTIHDCDGIAAGDINRDGKMDVLASASRRGRVFWFEYGESPRDWTRHLVQNMGHRGMKIEGNALGDFDGDGQLEAISLNQRVGDILIHRAKEDLTQPWDTAKIATGRRFLQDALVTDVNGDDQPDLVYTWEGQKKNRGGVHWLEFTGDDLLDREDWTDHKMVTHESAWWLVPRTMDLNDDGNAQEIVFAARAEKSRNAGSQPGIFWLEPGDDLTQPWTTHVIDQSMNHELHVDAGDFNGNGLSRDVVGGDFQSPTLAWYDFQSDWQRHRLPIPRIKGSEPKQVWNVKRLPLERSERDAILAVTSTGKRSAMVLIEFIDGAFQSRTLMDLPYGHPMDDRIILHDLTKDGRPELIIPDSGRGVNKLRVMRFNSSGRQ